MPIGAIIGGVASIGGALLSGSSNSKAIDKASDAQAAATREATALQKQIYNQNVGFQTPFLNTGQAAMGQINALLGLQVPNTPAQQLPGSTPGQQQGNSPIEPSWNDMSGVAAPLGMPFLRNAWARRISNGQATLADAPAWYRELVAGQQTTAPVAQTPVNPAPTQATAQSAYNQFKNYTGYTTRLNEANNALQSGYAAKGTLQSGAALQALAKMNQDYASNEFGNYMGYLGGQQQLGPGAANALSGVGTNYANAAGNLAIQNGNNIANAAIASANNRNQLYGNIAAGIGGMFGSSYG